MKHAEKVEMLARLKRDIALAESQRDEARAMGEADADADETDAPHVLEREWHRGVATAWSAVRERLLSLQRYVVSLPIDDLDTIVGTPKPAKKPAKKRAKKAPKRKPPMCL